MHVDIRKKLSTNDFHRIYSGDRRFYELLQSLGFDHKAGNQSLVLNYLSPDNHRHFFRGLIESDGSIGRYDGHCIVTIASHYDQNWSSLEGYAKSIGVEYRVKRVRYTTGNRSEFVVSSQKQFLRFLDEIYRDAAIDGVYLPRKYHKYLDVKRFITLGIPDDVTNLRKTPNQMSDRNDLTTDSSPQD
jgi:hypothetical protein